MVDRDKDKDWDMEGVLRNLIDRALEYRYSCNTEAQLGRLGSDG